jgi:hypothetical protein
VNRYRITLTHDAGRVRITTTASSIAAAIHIVLTAERAPESAIVKIEVLK